MLIRLKEHYNKITILKESSHLIFRGH